MLAQNLKTPADLGMDKKFHSTLVQILGMLERGELVHARALDPIPNGFNMTQIRNESECGTVLCIAGWVNKLAHDAKAPGNPNSQHDLAYGRLIMPPGWSGSGHEITCDQGAIALRNYLTSGEARWEEVLAE